MNSYFRLQSPIARKSCNILELTVNLEKVKKACSSVGIPENRIIILGDTQDSTGQFTHWTNVRSTSKTALLKQHNISPETDAVFLVYSSGTTGKPKGVRLSHYNVVSNVLQLHAAECKGLTWDGSKTTGDIPLPRPGTGGDKILACLPFFHIYGLVVLVHSPLYAGVTSIVLSRFNLKT
jgi:acyl-CoA synthetase (AMP-forming)/AMP-acid ligase II